MLAVCLSIAFYIGFPTQASDLTEKAETAETTEIPETTESLSVDEVWFTNDKLHITVADKDTGVSKTLELNLSEYAKSSDEIVSVQAVDNSGNKSNVLQFKNPYYKPETVSEKADATSEDDADSDTGNKTEKTESTETPTSNEESATESADSDGANPFTPEGAGKVVDNATEKDGKEFFSITTEDGNTFYLIVDRQRATDNVYLLNAVTENDLSSLAKPGDGTAAGAVPTPPAAVAPQPEITPAPDSEPETKPEPEAPPVTEKPAEKNGVLISITVIAIVLGGLGYYFIVIQNKNSDEDSDEDFDEDSDENSDESDDTDENDDENYDENYDELEEADDDDYDSYDNDNDDNYNNNNDKDGYDDNDGEGDYE
jgi:hypothetical protein